jgi:hypothetical protein
VADWPDFDPRGLLEALVGHGVDFVVVGGVAVVLHGSARLTDDLDISYSRDRGNLEALGVTLVGLNARPVGMDDDLPFAPDARTLEKVTILTLETDAGRIDLLAEPPGAPRYTSLKKHATKAQLGKVSVSVASIADMMAMKTASDRLIDRADLAELEAIARVARGVPPKDSFGNLPADQIRGIRENDGDD